MLEVKSKEKDYYVYTHSLVGQPPFYVGKGQLERIKQISRRNNYHHTNIVNKHGKENIIVRAMLCRDEKHALDLEVKIIAALRNGGVKLTNVTIGGEGKAGCPTSEETKAKIAASLRGQPFSEERRMKISVANKGKTHSAETKAKVAAHRTGKKHSEESKAKMSLNMKGKIISDEAKANMSIAAKNRKLLNRDSKGRFIKEQ
jgi:hypothetical protein